MDRKDGLDAILTLAKFDVIPENRIEAIRTLVQLSDTVHKGEIVKTIKLLVRDKDPEIANSAKESLEKLESRPEAGKR